MAAPGEAEAGLTLGLDVGPNFVVSDVPELADNLADPFGSDVGIGISGRAGYSFGAGFMRIAPEAKFGFESPGGPDAFRILGGARLTLAKGVAPVVFAHLGATLGDLEAFSWDVGGGLDLEFIPLSPGIFVSYNRVESAPGFVGDIGIDLDTVADNWQWVQVGLSITLDLTGKDK